MDLETYLHIIYGFDTAIYLLFLLITGHIIISKIRVLYINYIKYITFILGTTGLIHIYTRLYPVPLDPFIDIIDKTLIFIIPFLIVAAVLSFTGPTSRDKAAILRYPVIIGLISSIIIVLLFELFLPIATIQLYYWIIWDALFFSSLITSIYILIITKLKRKDSKTALNFVTWFIVSNLIGFFLTIIAEFLGEIAIELTNSFIMTFNAMILAYLVFYIDPLETERYIYSNLKNKFDAYMRYTSDGVAIIDRNGRFLTFNEGLKKMLNAKGEEIMGSSFTRFVPSDYRGMIEQMIESALHGSMKVENYFMMTPLGTKAPTKGDKKMGKGGNIHVISTFSRIKGPNDRSMGIMLVIKDITPSFQLKVERTLSKQIKAQNRLQKILTNLIPTLFKGGSAQGRAFFLNMVLDQVERTYKLEKKRNEELSESSGGVERDPVKGMGDYLCDVMNNLGGNHYWELVEGGSSGAVHNIHMYGIHCPWGDDCKKNPLLCNLCRGISTRLSQNEFEWTQVKMVSTIGNGSPRCLTELVLGQAKAPA